MEERAGCPRRLTAPGGRPFTCNTNLLAANRKGENERMAEKEEEERDAERERESTGQEKRGAPIWKLYSSGERASALATGYEKIFFASP